MKLIATKKYENLLFWLLTCSTYIPFHFISFGRSLPVSYGWYLQWAEEASRATVYKEWFFPMPPYSLWIMGVLPHHFGTGMATAEQLLAIVIWLVLVTGLYLITRDLFSPKAAFVSASISSVLYFSQPGNIIAGYFELAMALILIAVWATMRACTESQPNKIMIYCSVASFFANASALTKQTMLIPTIGIFALCVIGRNRLVSVTKSLLSVALGTAVAWVPVVVWAASNQALNPMVKAILRGGGKQVTQDTVLARVFNDLLSGTPVILIIFGLVLWVSLEIYSNSNAGIDNLKLIKVTQVFLSLFLVVCLLEPSFSTIATGLSNSFVIVLIFILIGIGVLEFTRICIPNWILTLLILVLLGLLIFDHFVTQSDLANLSRTLTATVIGLGVIWLTVVAADFKSREAESEKAKTLNVVILATLLILLANGLSGGNGMEAAVLPVTIFFAHLGNLVEKIDRNFALRIQVLLLCSIMLTSVVRAKNEPYEWFGIRAQSVSWKAPDKTLRNPMLGHFRLMSSEQKYYDALYKELNKHDMKSDVLFGPNNAGLATLNAAKAYQLTCPIIWWDVCPEELAALDFDRIQSNPPRGIVWNVPQQWVIDFHESVFRQGATSSIKSLNQWILAEVDSGNYKVEKIIYPDFGSIPNPESWKTLILVRAH